jgi:soluble lytic murein transglycosylase
LLKEQTHSTNLFVDTNYVISYNLRVMALGFLPAALVLLATPNRSALPFDPHWLEPYFQAPLLRAAAASFRASDWSTAATDFATALAKLPRASPERAPATYLLALAHANAGRWAQAEPLFEGLFSAAGPLAAYHAYNAARCHLRRGDGAGALVWAAKVPPDSIPAAEAALITIDALGAAHRWSEAEAAARAYPQRFPAGPRPSEALFARAQAQEALDRGADAAASYRELWSSATSDRWIDRAEARLQALAAAAASDPTAIAATTKTAGDWVGRGMVLFDQNRNEAAEAAFTAALEAPALTPALTCRAAYHRAQSIWKQRQRARAQPLFAQAIGACQAARDDDLTVKALYQRARCLASAGTSTDRTAALAAYAQLERDHPDHSYADDARVRAAEEAWRSGDEAAAEALLEQLPERYPAGDNVGEALWRLAFRSFQRQDFAATHHWLDLNLRLVPLATRWDSEGRAEYWQARAFERQHDTPAALPWYERAVQRYPLSVYALLSLQRLATAAPARHGSLIRELRAGFTAATPRIDFAPSPLYATPGFRRGLLLARMGQDADAHREFARLATTVAPGRPRDDLAWITALVLDRGHLWSAAHAIPAAHAATFRARYPLAAGITRWRLTYPRAFADLVASASRLNAVPEALQLALMREESAFDPRAVSTANCLGLTMLKPDTAAELNGQPIAREKLFDPPTNIRLGSRHLAFLLKRYRSHPLPAIAAYNAGLGAVDRWIRERGQLPLDEFLETIPFDETRGYTKRVLASFFAYTWLYSPRPVPALTLAPLRE